MTGAKIIDGKAVAQEVRARVAAEVSEFTADNGYAPTLATVLVGADPASQVYVANKKKGCEEVGIRSIGHDLPADTSEADLISLVQSLNADPDTHGILVQLPLPDQIDSDAVIAHISPRKDVDGLTAENAGLLVQGRDCLVACTPSGVIELLDHSGVELEGADAVIVGRSHLVGKPLISLLLARNATVTICHSRTRDLGAVCRQADILIAAVGKPELIVQDMVKPGAAVIDVGINRTEDGLVGDVDFESVCEVAGAITPVPGGVGPMTITMLLSNTLKAAKGLSL